MCNLERTDRSQSPSFFAYTGSTRSATAGFQQLGSPPFYSVNSNSALFSCFASLDSAGTKMNVMILN
jgi:hypothetical protein